MLENRRSQEERLDYFVRTYGSEIEALQVAAQSIDKEYRAMIYDRIEHLHESHRLVREKLYQLKSVEESIWEKRRIIVDGLLDEINLNLIRILSDLVRYRYRL
jgi:hypothetical protein